MHTAFVLAAGLGTRLRPLTTYRPKALVPVCGVPMLDYTLAGLARDGHRRVMVNAFWLPRQLEAYAGRREGVEVTVHVERGQILGTGGALRAVADKLAPRVAVVNADVLCDVRTDKLVEAVPEGGAALLLRRHAEDAARYGVVAADEEGVITHLSSVGRAEPVGAEADDTHFTGLHAVDRDALALVPPEGEQCIVRTAYRALLPERRLRGVVHGGYWLDVGDPAAYLAANLAVLCSTMPVPIDPVKRASFARGPRGNVGRAPAGARVDGSVWWGKDVRYGSDVLVRDSVVGDGATLADGAKLTRCVVWDGAFVPTGTHVDRVFYGFEVLDVR